MKRRDPAGLLVDRWAGWLVRHEPSGLPMIPSLRLRRHAQAAMADLAATRVDFTRSAEELRGTADLRRAQQAAMPWYERARVCCADGEQYSPLHLHPAGRRVLLGAPRTPWEAAVVNRRKWEEQEAARWAPASVPENPPVRAGRPPRMTYLPWRNSQDVDMGMTAPQESWWRYRPPRCRRFSGPYSDSMNAKRDGMDHMAMAHPQPERRSRRPR